ncbi:unnamed protein product [Rhizoctonia solani]|uniref:Cytoplasmic tRNA 2-thiolation protein 1 n=1 Tax=Rhizoctonia solani TaxID=456999 RepID=A0A8H3GX84_9AGAM|nr:unnamed protein product [Rhizoctonia solani]
MPPRPCELCHTARAILKRPKTGQQICKECFFKVFETEVHNTIIDNQLFKPGDRVAIGASGGKDSTVLRVTYFQNLLAMLIPELNKDDRIDEGITGYRDDSLETVKRNQQQYDLPLKILSYDELYGWTMDRIVEQVGRKNNFMRGDIARLGRCTQITTQSEDTIKRSKPFKYAYEKMRGDAYRGHARVFLKDLEAARPSAIVDIIHSGEAFALREEVKVVAKVQRKWCIYKRSDPDYFLSLDKLHTHVKLITNVQGLYDAGRVGEGIAEACNYRRNKEFEGPMPENARTIPTFERKPTNINSDETSKNNTANEANKSPNVSL